MEHIRALADTIGPRGSTTPQEAEAARYVAQVLHDMGLEPHTETFRSARSSYYPYALFAGLVLVGELLFWIGGRAGALVALVLALVATVSVLLEAAFRPNLLRWLLPKGTSQNVFAWIASSQPANRQVALLAHLDSHRTPLLFSSDSWVKLFGRLVPATLGATGLLVVLYAIDLIYPGLLWHLLSLLPALFVLVLFLLVLQADRTPYTAGANDNASGVAVVLDLAQRLSVQPLVHTAVSVVLTGCEEVGCYGADAFARAHRETLGEPYWITVDSVGGSGADPAYVRKETFLLTTRSDPGLLDLADQVAASQPALGAYGCDFAGAYTEGAIGGLHGFPVLTLLALRRDGALPAWHRPTDVLEAVDPDVVHRCQDFVWALLQKVDRQGSAETRQ